MPGKKDFLPIFFTSYSPLKALFSSSSSSFKETFMTNLAPIMFLLLVVKFEEEEGK